MRKLKIAAALLISTLSLASCADSKEFVIDGKLTTVEPYGWFDLDEKNDSIHYEVCIPNAFLSVIFSETIIAPVWITGTQIFEPIKKSK
jgi:type IV pilus biogenesis protein CpaD/CtpE